ncbi:MAG: RNA polymerase factor sigma-54 [Candidatus Brocadiaceae bacterium]|nr:RNA polymerase factor sigma-54 [Candidatus Brocadiaceae bacterium]
MRLEASLQARQEMRLKLAPQIIQSIEILQLPLLELRERIDQELLENPLLEVAGPEDAADGEAPEDGPVEDLEVVEPLQEEPETEPEPLEDEDYDAVEEIIRQAEGEATELGVRGSPADDEDGKRAAIENSPAPEITLADHLQSQITYLDLAPEVLAACENIIANLDWRGYLEYPLEEIVESMDEPVDIELARQALRVVQGLEPPGVGARTLEECLLLQLDEHAPDYPLLRQLISEHFQDILKNRYPGIVRALGCTMEELKHAIDQIGALNPMPGALFGEQTAPHVVPDLRVELVDGEYRVMLEDADLPPLRIAAYYARRLQREDLDARTQAYLKDKLQGARWLIDAIQQRRSTIYNIASAIVEEQKAFFDKGPMALKPLRMQEIADRVGVHVSTVSRALAGKHVQTPRGVFSLKHFFTGGVEKNDGEVESWEVVRQKLLQIIENEDKTNPLSDDQVAAQLAAQGIEIARRTVSKYRKVLGIPSSRRRKEY